MPVDDFQRKQIERIFERRDMLDSYDQGFIESIKKNVDNLPNFELSAAQNKHLMRLSFKVSK